MSDYVACLFKMPQLIAYGSFCSEKPIGNELRELFNNLNSKYQFFRGVFTRRGAWFILERCSLSIVVSFRSYAQSSTCFNVSITAIPTPFPLASENITTAVSRSFDDCSELFTKIVNEVNEWMNMQNHHDVEELAPQLIIPM